MVNFLCRAMSTALARIPSLVYAALFLLCIPVFATIFAAHSREFFHTTVVHEQGYQDLKDRITAGIHAAITRATATADPDNLVTQGAWSVDPDGLVVSDVSARGGDLRLELVAPAVNAQAKASSSHVVTVLLSDLYGIEKEKEGRAYHYFMVLPEDLGGLPVPLSRLFPGDADYPSGKAAFLPVSQELARDVSAFLDGARGFPSDEQGQFPRMLYFSAVTITTLGYGDIVPISDRARALVGVESVLGLILVGLFLNSLSHEHAEARERRRVKQAARAARESGRDADKDRTLGKVMSTVRAKGKAREAAPDRKSRKKAEERAARQAAEKALDLGPFGGDGSDEKS